MANSYSDAYLDSEVDSASPLQLIYLAYESAISGVEEARDHLKNGRIADRARVITRVQAILRELSAALDFKAAPEMSLQLARLYEYMTDRLREANFKQSEAPLIEVEGLLRSLGDSWRQLADNDAVHGHMPAVPAIPDPQETGSQERSPWAQPSDDQSSRRGEYTF